MRAQSACDVIILCGGLGTRLRSVVHDRPKPMADVDGRPFLDLLVDHVVAHGFSRVIFCTGHLGEWVRDHFGRRRDIDAVISQESLPLGTGGALRAALGYVSSSTVLVLNGDSLCPIDLTAFVARHRETDAVITMAVVPSDGRDDAGGITIGSDGRVTAFEEKHSSAWLNAGIYAIESRALARIPADRTCSLERDIFSTWPTSSMQALRYETAVHDIGTPARLESFQRRHRARHVTAGEEGMMS